MSAATTYYWRIDEQNVGGTTTGILWHFTTVAAMTYSGGNGEPNNPYQIATVSDWNDLMHTPADWCRNFIMTADINLQGITLTPVGNFSGVFNGNNRIIRNVVINSGFETGLFGVLGGGNILNLGVENVNIIGSDYVGGLVGWNEGGINNCYVTGTVSGSEKVGGLVGENYGGISSCYTTGVVSGDSDVGGLVGEHWDGSITNCYSMGTISGSGAVGGLAGYNGSWISTCYSMGTVSGSGAVGGLAGYNENSISNCYSTSTVSGSSTSQSVGGLVGNGYYGSRISNCYSTGTVSGDSDVGGLVGTNIGCGGGSCGSSINNCYSTGTVIGSSDVGGLVGYYSNSTINNSFWDIETSGQSTSAGGTGKTTAEMKTESTFTSADWDFSYTDGNDAVWYMAMNGYPILTWQISPADIYTDGKNNFRDFAVLAKYWMRDDCRRYNNYCEWADLNFDGSVNIDDLVIFMTYWLQSGIYE
jgi:hypothetical protein